MSTQRLRQMSPGVDRGFKDFIPEATTSCVRRNQADKEEGERGKGKGEVHRSKMDGGKAKPQSPFTPLPFPLYRWRMDCATKATKLITPPAIVKVHSTSALLRCIVARNITIPHFHPSC